MRDGEVREIDGERLSVHKTFEGNWLLMKLPQKPGLEKFIDSLYLNSTTHSSVEIAKQNAEETALALLEHLECMIGECKDIGGAYLCREARKWCGRGNN